MKYTLNAEGKSVGRVASEAAKILMGKNTAEFARNVAPVVTVEIVNAAKAHVTTARKETQLKSRYTRYPSGLITPTVGYVIEKRGIKELFRKAVYGMLPSNKLRSRMIKNLVVTE